MKYWLCLKISASALRALGAPEGFRSPVQVAVWLFGCMRVDFCSGGIVGGWQHETRSVVTNSSVL